MTANISIDCLEKAILGTMLKENNLILDANIQSSMFQSHVHRTIHKNMVELISEQKPVTHLTLLVKLNPQDIGGANYLLELQNNALKDHINVYLKLFFESFRKNETNRLMNRALVEQWSLQQIQESLQTIESIGIKEDFHSKNVLSQLYELAFHPKEKKDVVQTVIPDLKMLIDGFRSGEVTIIAGRPSMGKTDVMNHFALHAGWAGYFPIIFSLEMNQMSIYSRIIASVGKINRNKMRDPYSYLSDDQKKDWPQIIDRVAKANLYIDDSPGMSIHTIRAKARKIVKASPTKKPIIFIDYLQIIHSERQGNQTNIIGEISWAIKQLAKELNCPIVCLSQLNRNVEARHNKRPVISDIRDSGNIEQDADIVILLYRENYYEQVNGSSSVQQMKQMPIDRLELIVAKNRNGDTGVAYAAYNKATGEIVGMRHGGSSVKAANN